MSQAFLTPLIDRGATVRSPLADTALAAGAEIGLLGGWQMPVGFGDEVAELAACERTVGFADVSHLTKLELQGVDKVDFGPGLATRADGVWTCPVAPGRSLLVCEPDRGEVVRAGAGAARVVDLTAALAAIVVAGPLARDVFARLCALDLRQSRLPLGGFRPGSVARTPGYLLREGADRLLVLFGAAFAAYFWETIADAAERLGGRPVGPRSLPGIEVGCDA